MGKTSLDYDEIISELAKNEDAYRFCLHRIYPLLGFQVLKESEVRPVDLKEWLPNKLEKMIPEQVQKDYPGTKDFYLYIMKLLFEQKISCEKGSRAEKYKKRAYELLSEAKRNKSHNSIFDSLMIMLSLFRPKIEETETSIVYLTKATKIEITVKQEDINILENVLKNKMLLPSNIIKKKDLMDMVYGIEYETKQAMRFFFISSVMLLTDLLKDRGYFNKIEERQ